MRSRCWPRMLLCATLVLHLSACITPAPTVSPPAGVYACPTVVTLNDSRAGAEIFYTTDGSAPTPSSIKYAAPFAVNAGDPVQAVARAPGSRLSSVTSLSYTCHGVTAAGFASQMQQLFTLPQPRVLVRFTDLAPGDFRYGPAQAISPYLNRHVLCPNCMLAAAFGPSEPVTHGASGVFFVTYLMSQSKLQLLSESDTSRVLADVADAGSLHDLKRRYLATAVQNGLLPLQEGKTIQQSAPLTAQELSLVLQNIHSRFNVPPAALR